MTDLDSKILQILDVDYGGSAGFVGDTTIADIKALIASEIKEILPDSILEDGSFPHIANPWPDDPIAFGHNRCLDTIQANAKKRGYEL